MQKSRLIFVYGSNMDPAQMRERCPESDLAWFIAEAKNKELCFPRKSEKRKGGVGSIRESKGESVWGVVFSITERDRDRLDSFEGLRSNSYTREPIQVSSEDGGHHKVETYIATPQDSPAKEYVPHKDYIQLYIRGAEYFRLPAGYVEKLKRIKAKDTKE